MQIAAVHNVFPTHGALCRLAYYDDDASSSLRTAMIGDDADMLLEPTLTTTTIKSWPSLVVFVPEIASRRNMGWRCTQLVVILLSLRLTKGCFLGWTGPFVIASKYCCSSLRQPCGHIVHTAQIS